MDQKKYIKSVCKKLQCTKRKKKEIARQLESDIGCALDNGETMEQVCERMGTVKELVAEFNENMSDDERKAAGKSKRLKIIGIIIAVILVIGCAGYYFFPKVTPIEESTLFDGEQLEQRCISVISALDEKDYETLQSEYVSDAFQSYVTAEVLENAKKTISADWGSRKTVGTGYMCVIKQGGKQYARIELTVSYENVIVIYIMGFDKDYKLTGLWMR